MYAEFPKRDAFDPAFSLPAPSDKLSFLPPPLHTPLAMSDEDDPEYRALAGEDDQLDDDNLDGMLHRLMAQKPHCAHHYTLF